MDISLFIYSFALYHVYVIDVSEAASSTQPPCVPDASHRDSWRKEDFPNPQINIDKCGRNCKKSWICDPSHILSRSAGDELDELIERVSRSGKCSCSQCSYPDGYNIAVAIVPSMSYSGSAKAAAQSFAYYLRVNWDFEECDNNVVIFVSRDDRKVYTESGPTAYKILTTECVEEVYNRVKPKLSEGWYSSALDEMIVQYKTIFERGNCEHIKDNSLSAGAIAGIVIGSLSGVGIIACFCCIWCGCCSGGGGGSRGGRSGGHRSYFHSSSGGGGGGGGFFGGSSGDGGGGGGGDF
ncbi:Hypothetical predicted protein [Mytilus galloprovincialis]|uniref:TPM domain-containing protein n=1 Tax=Mytilus galloprovincialis TaxID=29158 RepID=A0A8B6CYA9_MYTGA|nr:Hypothetical predicted protein [Mytilus galloprovincialis]